MVYIHDSRQNVNDNERNGISTHTYVSKIKRFIRKLQIFNCAKSILASYRHSHYNRYDTIANLMNEPLDTLRLFFIPDCSSLEFVSFLP